MKVEIECSNRDRGWMDWLSVSDMDDARRQAREIANFQGMHTAIKDPETGKWHDIPMDRKPAPTRLDVM